MGLFSKSDIDKINEVAKKSKTISTSRSNINARSMTKDINEMSQAVIDYFPDSKSILITTKEDLHSYIDSCIEFGYCGIDTETTGLDRTNDKIVGVSLYVPGKEECYIPLKHIVPLFETPYKNQLSYEDVSEELQRLVDNNVRMIFANADFDIVMIYNNLGVDFIDVCYFDVLIAARCLKEDEPRGDLKSLYNKYVLKGKGDPKKFSDFFSVKLFPYCTPDVAKLYAANDAKITYELFRWQLPFVTKDNPKCVKRGLQQIADLVWNLEFPLIKVCVDLYRTGMYLDSTTAKSLHDKYSKQMNDATEKLAKMVQTELDKTVVPIGKRVPFTSGKDFNCESPLQVKYLLYDVMKLPKVGDNESTGKEVLHDINLPITNQILHVRSLGVLMNTFIDKLPEVSGEDFRIHAQLKQMGAACVVGDTIIATDRGYERIDSEFSEFDIPGEFYSLQDSLNVINGDQIYEPSTHKIFYKNVPTIRIRTRRGLTIEGTHNHPVLVSGDSSSILDGKDQFVPLERLKSGDILKIPVKYHPQIDDYVYLGLDIEVFKYEDIENNDWTYNISELLMDEYFSEFLGIYNACGGYSVDGEVLTVEFSTNNQTVLDELNYLSKQMFKVDLRDNKIKFKYSKHLEIFFMKVDYLNIIGDSQPGIINIFIKGLTVNSRITRNANKNILYQLNIEKDYDRKFIQMHLLSQGIISNDESNEGYLQLDEYNYTTFRDRIGFLESNKIITSGLQHEHMKSYKPDYVYDRVSTIRESYADVYDLVVPGTHSFISNGMISHNTGRMSCIAEGTKVARINGKKRIEDILVGDYVYCFDDEMHLKVSKVLSKMFNGVKKCIKINWKCEGVPFTGYLKCTPDHKVLLKSGKWVEARELKPDDRVAHFEVRALHDHIIDSIEECEDCNVYDLEIEDNHTFFANEICVHNCSDPNLQNIPSHASDIRHMFRGTPSKYEEMELKGSSDTELDLDVSKYDSVQVVTDVERVWKPVHDLTVGDVIIIQDDFGKESTVRVCNLSEGSKPFKLKVSLGFLG